MLRRPLPTTLTPFPLPPSGTRPLSVRAPRPAVRALLMVVCAALLVSGCGDATGPDDDLLPELIVFSINPPDQAESEGRDIYVVRPDGSERTRLTTGMQAVGPAWSPDGRKIAFGTLPWGDGSIYVMNADGTELQAVASGPGFRIGPSWSPDGEEIVFALRDSMYTVAAEGGDPTLLHACALGCQWPSWSPDGDRIVFVAWPGENTRSPFVYILDVDGQDVVPLATGLEYEHLPAWSPDGSRLVFVGGAGSSFGLFTASADGTAVTRLTVDGSSPAFSRDGDRIVFHQMGFAEGEQAGIFSMDAAGGEPELVVPFPERTHYFATPRWRP